MWQGRYGTARNAAQCLWARQYNIAYKVHRESAGAGTRVYWLLLFRSLEIV